MRIFASVVVFFLAAGLAGAQQVHPRDGEIHDADTLAWWHTTELLSSDAMQGRDTGTAAYQRAAEYVAARYKAAGLKPAGDGGTYFQTVPMHEVRVEPEGTSFVVERPGGGAGGELKLAFLQEMMVGASESALREGTGALVFRGYCGKDAMEGVKGRVVVCFGTQRAGLPSGLERMSNARAAGALGVVSVDDPYFSIEPPRWPYAYARSVTLKTDKEDAKGAAMLPPMRLSAEAFRKLVAGSGQDADAVLKAGGAKQPLPNFEIPGKLRVKLELKSRDISSPNVLAVLPGSDPALAAQYVAVGAHLDGYGFGTPVAGDNLYNGALDDAAYVALLIQMADDLRAGGTVDVAAKGVRLGLPKRSILFCAFTGEEKGLLGSRWFVAHPTVPVGELAADINLDQLRPLFPLKILTAEALGDTTLGATATEVGKGMGIEIRADREPERSLLRRADQYPFLQIHVPAISFIFGYDAGTDAERRYRQWYAVRYHRPQDDVTQPMDFDAATKFDVFFYRLVEAVADAPVRPAFLPGSQFVGRK
ncbi:MAG: M28 family peptidase [Acidobacteria bacterium]|nr:M28 family peptidase [Acidobacteriota bacterium]